MGNTSSIGRLKAAILAVLGRRRLLTPPRTGGRAGAHVAATMRRPSIDSKAAPLAERQAIIQAERDRIAAILALPEAQHNLALAAELALDGVGDVAIRRVLQSAARVRPSAGYAAQAAPRHVPDNTAARAAAVVAAAENCAPLALGHWRNRISTSVSSAQPPRPGGAQ